MRGELREHDPDVDEREEGVDVEDRITEVEEALTGIFDNPANGVLLSGILDQARASYEKDPSEWEKFFSELQTGLIATDDEDNIRDMLDQYSRKAKSELS